MTQSINLNFLRILIFLEIRLPRLKDIICFFFVYYRIASAPSSTKKYPVTWCVLVELKYNKTVRLIYITSLLHLLCKRMVYILFLCNILFFFVSLYWTYPWFSYTRTCAEKCALREFSEKMKTFRLDSYPFILLIPN